MFIPWSQNHVIFLCREACINFRELCKKKHGDGLWMQELAAMQACPPSELAFMGTSGIMLTNDSVLNQNISLNELLDPSRSDSTADDASADNKKGRPCSHHITCQQFFFCNELKKNNHTSDASY